MQDHPAKKSSAQQKTNEGGAKTFSMPYQNIPFPGFLKVSLICTR
jgi:hypothetical protein